MVRGRLILTLPLKPPPFSLHPHPPHITFAYIVQESVAASDTDTVDEGTTSALATLQIDCVPATLQQLQTVVLQHLRANNAADGDGSFDSPAAQQRKLDVLTARRILSKVITARSLKETADAMALRGIHA